jgi:hypothetical protein
VPRQSVYLRIENPDSLLISSSLNAVWGGGYVLYAAEKGYVAYTNCTSTLVRIFWPWAQWATLLG